MADRIERYLAELRAALEVSAPLAERILSEAEDHLREGAAWEEDRGLCPEEAQREVTERFGPPQVVGRWWNEIYQREYGGGKMWQRFTERARRVVFFAQDEATRLGEDYVGTEHLLLGLVRERDSVAARLLEGRLGISLSGIRKGVEKQATRGPGRTEREMQLTPRAKRAIDLAYEEARNLSNNYIGTDHLLLGLVREEEGLGGRVLRESGADLERTRREVQAMQEEAETLTQRVKAEFVRAVERGTNLSEEMLALINVLTVDDAGRLADAITPHLALEPDDLQALVKTKPPADRLEKLSELLKTATVRLEGAGHWKEGEPSETEPGREIDRPVSAPAEAGTARESSDAAAIARIARTILQQAVKDYAATIQIEPGASYVMARYEIDGVLHDKMKLPAHIHPRLVGCYKRMAGMDPEEHGLAQMGHSVLSIEGQDYDLDVRTEPTPAGELVAINLQPRG